MITHVAIAAEAAAGKLSTNIVTFGVSQQLTIIDVSLIISTGNEYRAGAAAGAVEEQLTKQAQLKPVHCESNRENRWALLGYIDSVVHVQRAEGRSLYNLERLWKDYPQIPPNIYEVPVPQDNEEQ